MASMRNHRVIEVYRSKEVDARGNRSDDRYHVTSAGRVLKTTGPKGGNPKMMMVDDKGRFRCGLMAGQGRRMHVDEFRARLEQMERES